MTDPAVRPMRPTLHYVYDPLCGWCYAAGPLIAAAAEAGVAIALHGGGLFDRPTRVDPGKRAYMRQSDARIAAMAGVAFGPRYLDGLLADPDTVFWSRPVIAAILAAGSIRPGADVAMLHAVQHAHYVDGRRVADTATLIEVAGSIDLPADDFRRAMEDAPVEPHIARSRQVMRQAGLAGFPGMLLERADGLVQVEHEPFYGRPAEFAHAVERLGEDVA